MDSEIYQCDVLIIGSGGAGSRAAIEVFNNGQTPVIVSKGLSFKSGCTGMAEGGYNAAITRINPEDNPQIHYEDTLKGGGYLNDKELVEILVENSPKRLEDLEKYGALFDRKEDGTLNQRPFGGQSKKRTYFQSDRTGHEIITSLKEEIIKNKIKTFDEIMITSLITNKKGNKVIGALGLNLKDSTTIFFQAKTIILASGGAGQLFPITSNTIQKNGDGFTLGYNIGAELIDMEEIQFHPTGMVFPNSKKGVLVTEAVRGEGGILLNKNNERFMEKYDERKELATRDVVARSIYNEIITNNGCEHGGVYLDISHLDDKIIEEKLETMLEQFLDVGIDIRKEKMEVAPTAHHFMGGIRINKNCQTNIENLYGAGEVTGGVHGANRLGGNALADTQVFGKIAGEQASKKAKNEKFETNTKMIEKEEEKIKKIYKNGEYNPTRLKNELKEIMWKHASIIRNETKLKEGLEKINKIKEKTKDLKIPNTKEYNTKLINAIELQNMIQICELIIKSALIRKESRGAHYRDDYPETKKEWEKSIVLTKGKEPYCVLR